MTNYTAPTDINTLHAGDLIEAVLAGKKASGEPLDRKVRVRLTRTPYMVNDHSATVMGHSTFTGAWNALAVLADSIVRIDEEPISQTKIASALKLRSRRAAVTSRATTAVALLTAELQVIEDTMTPAEKAAYDQEVTR